ncbi:SGNH/GDSL hydrolase family protein [Nocardioides acrostichi]|uniref:SGNH/GDSL hydrolase family protein n=1 Tax=Nocardioides acrostichi TaxID=2784339 RepID=A0A930UUR0_9ACTN|nr:SGNH/GDSL hydrolase family protein [Nocardioides acrostichi]MBF4161208.1 SGNH/GDSL hydrolase family protein [Nocardioides acrostichi]
MRRARRLTAVLTIAGVLAVGAAACTSSDDDPDAAPSSASPSSSSSADDEDPFAPSSSADVGTGAYPRYVALGDSYTAAPLVPKTDPASACLQSTGNYPHLIAAQLEGTVLDDRSCSGADTTSLIGVQTTGRGDVPPQLSAVTPRTSLVTLSIGGNDFGVFGSIIGACSQSQGSGTRCKDAAEVKVGATLKKISTRVSSAVTGVLDRAPDATVIVVGYPQVIPSTGSCPDLLPVAAKDLPFALRVNRMLNAALEQAATRSDAGFVDTFALSKGHDICADDPWVNGQATQPDAALAYHPFAAEQQAVAKAVLSMLEQ